MRKLSNWLNEYGATHQNPVNRRFHAVCVPLILISFLGLLWSVPSPINIAEIAMGLSLAFYLKLGARPFFTMLIFYSILLPFFYWARSFGNVAPVIFGAVFALAWVGQFIGHHVEGKKPSFFEDLQFLLIGPLWVLTHFNFIRRFVTEQKI